MKYLSILQFKFYLNILYKLFDKGRLLYHLNLILKLPSKSKTSALPVFSNT